MILIFLEIYELGIYIYTKSMTILRYVTFLYKNPDISKKKRKTICVTFFYIQVTQHFATIKFSWKWWNWPRGARFFLKQINFELQIICKKQCTFRYVLVYKKPRTLRHIFLSKKQRTLRCVFIFTFFYV